LRPNSLRIGTGNFFGVTGNSFQRTGNSSTRTANSNILTLRGHQCVLWQNCFAERLIGMIRREFVDHLVVFGEGHQRRALIQFAAYYNECRIHRSLNKDAPFHRAIEHLGAITSRPVLVVFITSIAGPDF
jgi:Integrase core domain